MEWQFAVGLILAIPVVLFPAAFVWYLNVGGIYQAIRARRARSLARKVPALNRQRPPRDREEVGQQNSEDIRKSREKEQQIGKAASR